MDQGGQRHDDRPTRSDDTTIPEGTALQRASRDNTDTASSNAYISGNIQVLSSHELATHGETPPEVHSNNNWAGRPVTVWQQQGGSRVQCCLVSSGQPSLLA